MKQIIFCLLFILLIERSLQDDQAAEETVSKFTNMVWITPGIYSMGGDNPTSEQPDFSKDEYPKHTVQVDGFYMDITEVTVAQWKKFADETKYKTIAEIDVDWDEMVKQMPEGTPRPPEEILKAGALVFTRPSEEILNLNDYAQWWAWTTGANWRFPEGPNKPDVEAKDNYPVTMIAWDDAKAYCDWIGGRLPTEAEFEWASRDGKENNIYPWGNEYMPNNEAKGNWFQGTFPHNNTVVDGFEGVAPIKQFAPNGYGLYDLTGNVWEWVSDLYHYNYYEMLVEELKIECKTKTGCIESDLIADNPIGPTTSWDPEEPYTPKRTMRGGSYLCNQQYCSGYRNARRMKSSPDTGLSNSGFRCVKDGAAPEGYVKRIKKSTPADEDVLDLD